jgi:hypothetical protein
MVIERKSVAKIGGTKRGSEIVFHGREPNISWLDVQSCLLGCTAM